MNNVIYNNLIIIKKKKKKRRGVRRIIFRIINKIRRIRIKKLIICHNGFPPEQMRLLR